MIKGLTALLDNTQDAMHRAAIFCGTWEFIQHKSRNKTYISDEQLHAMELCIYHGIKVQVDGLDSERISQIYQCTRSQSWWGGDRRNDWVWVKQRLGRCYGALNGCLPWQLQRLLKINLQNEDGGFVEYWLALALITIPENLSSMDPISNIVHVRKVLADFALQLFSIEIIVSSRQVIPEIATGSKTRDRRNKRSIVISHIDLATWNDVYN